MSALLAVDGAFNPNGGPIYVKPLPTGKEPPPDPEEAPKVVVEREDLQARARRQLKEREANLSIVTDEDPGDAQPLHVRPAPGRYTVAANEPSRMLGRGIYAVYVKSGWSADVFSDGDFCLYPPECPPLEPYRDANAGPAGFPGHRLCSNCGAPRGEYHHTGCALEREAGL